MNNIFDYLKWIYKLNTVTYSINDEFTSTDELIQGFINKYLKKHLKEAKRLSVIITDSMCYFGIIRTDEKIFLVGPALNKPADISFAKELALELGISQAQCAELFVKLQCLPSINAVDFAKLICMVNFTLTGEDVSADSVFENNTDSKNIFDSDNAATQFSKAGESRNYYLERKMLELIRQGNTQALKQYLSNASIKTSFNLTDSTLRSVKNIVIITSTLASRAAIDGGADVEKSMAMSDSYIKTAEACSSVDSLFKLLAKVVFDFAGAAGEANIPENVSVKTEACIKYVRRNISEKLNVSVIAQKLGVSSNYLSALFSKEMNMTLGTYIMNTKCDEAKRLLESTDASISDISEYLMFSSQSHFQNKFKQYTGLTPLEYRTQKVNS